MRAPVAALVALVGLWAMHLVHSLGRAPAVIATHFGAAGVPNGWMSRHGMVVFSVGVLGFVLLVVVGTAYLIRFIPPKLINIPNRDYWFAPERRSASADRVFRHMLWLACLMVAFLTAINHLVFRANLGGAGPRLSPASLLTTVSAFLGSLGLWVARLYRRFPRPPG
jgi:serine/threonine-protein kinase